MNMQNPNNLGSASWADMRTIADRHRYNPETDFFIGRNPFNYHDAIGLNDDRHVFLCAGTGGGKGRSVVINNLLQWRGSIVSVDPKGENASIAAARRGDGDKYSEGLGQKTYVLDPYGLAKVPKKYRASCNLLDILDAKAGDLLSQCETLAEAMRLSQEGGESESWSKDGAEFTALVIAHVKTSKYYAKNLRSLVTVRKLITEGNIEGLEFIRKLNQKETKLATQEGRAPDLKTEVDPYMLLLWEIRQNKAQKGALSRRAASYLNLLKTNSKQFGSIINNSTGETRFIDDLQMQDQVTISDHRGRSFNIADLQDDPKGISVFLCLPDDPDHTAIRWQKAMLTMIMLKMKRDQNDPATGKKVLMVLDEFASMGKMTTVTNGFNSIRGAGIKLFLIVTQIADLKGYYDKSWQKILAGCSLKMWFSINDYETQEFMQNSFGEAHVTLYAKSASVAKTKGKSNSQSTAKGETFNESVSEGKSKSDNVGYSVGESETHNQSMTISDTETWNETTGRTDSQSHARGRTWNHSDSITNGSNRNRSSGDNTSSTYGGFFRTALLSTNYGRNSNTSSGTNKSRTSGKNHGGSDTDTSSIALNRSSAAGGSRGVSKQESTATGRTRSKNVGRTDTMSLTYSHGYARSETITETFGTNESTTLTTGIQEGFHKRPLITVSEIHDYLQRVDLREHPAYPGFMIVSMAGAWGGEQPFLARKCYYDQDEIFEGCFTPHYNFKNNFLPKSQQRLVGGEYTPEHFVPVRIPVPVIEAAQAVSVELSKISDEWFNQGEPLFEWTAPHYSENADRLKNAKSTIRQETQDLSSSAPRCLSEMTIDNRVGLPVLGKTRAIAPYTGKVIDYALKEAFQESGDIMLLRMERPFSDEDREEFEKTVFGELIDYVLDAAEAQNKLNAMIKALNEAYKKEWGDHQDYLRKLADEYKRRKADEAEAEAKRIEDAKNQQRLAELTTEQDAFKLKYKWVIWPMWIILPILGIITLCAEVTFDADSFKSQSHYKTTDSWKFSWNTPSKKQCGSTYSVVSKHGLYYKYTCTKRTGVTTNRPISGFALVWDIVKIFLTSLAILYVLILYNKFTAKVEPSYSDGRPSHKEFSGQTDYVKEAAKEVFGDLSENRACFWIVIILLIIGIIYYDVMTSHYSVYGDVR